MYHDMLFKMSHYLLNVMKVVTPQYYITHSYMYLINYLIIYFKDFLINFNYH